MNDQSTNQTKNHCMVVHAYYPLGEPRVEREALALVDSGYSVDVLCLRKDSEKPFEVVQGVRVFRLPVRRKVSRRIFNQIFEYLHFFISVFFKLIRLQIERRYQTVQTHNLPDFLVFSTLFSKLAGARLILDLHDLMPEFMAVRIGKPMDSWPVRLTILQEQLACRFANQVITVTDLWKDRLIKRGVKGEKISVVMNLADEHFFKPIPYTKRPPRQSNRFTLIYHGGFKQRYGMDVLIRSMAIVKEKAPNIRLILQGTGDFAPDMAAMVNEYDLHDCVQINDFTIRTSELPSLIYQADMGVVPNYDDLFTGDLLPTKLLEYVSLEVPVIAARTRVISSYFDETMLRFFTPGDEHSLADAILDAYFHREQLLDQARQMQSFNHKYNWTSMARHYVSLIDRLNHQAVRQNSRNPADEAKQDGLM